MAKERGGTSCEDPPREWSAEKGGEMMKEGYFGKIKNSGGQYVKAVYTGSESSAPKAASYKGNGTGKFTGKNKKEKK